MCDIWELRQQVLQQWKINIIQKNCDYHHHHHHHPHYHHHLTWRDQRDNGKESPRPTQDWKEQKGRFGKMTIKSCLVWTLPEAHTEPKQTSWVRDIRCFRDLLVFHEPLGIRVLLKVNMFSYKTLKSQWYWIYSHIWPWNPIESYYILIKSCWECLYSYIWLWNPVESDYILMTLKCCWEWIYSHIWLWNPVENDYILIYDFEMLLRVDISLYMTSKCCWEWIYFHSWLWNPVESDYILMTLKCC